MTDTATLSAVTIDSFGLTDVGRVRGHNEDHFLIATVSKSVDVQHTSLSSEALATRFGAASGHLFAVADGVGGRPDGDVASERTVAAVLGYVGQAAACFQGLNATSEHQLLGKLEETVQAVHEGLLTEYGKPPKKIPATTLTLVLLVWPRAYLVHIGDSRAYVRRRGRLQRLTTDQTFGEYMQSAGAWTAEQAARAGSASTLSSAVGGSELLPVVGLVDLEPGDALLLCTDGLTKHVSDERIAEALAGPESAARTGRQLVDEALAAGGTDNVTLIVVRTAAA
jgi:PPM family protein phosphatase